MSPLAPLPYLHPPGPLDETAVAACTRPERPYYWADKVFVAQACPGCTAFAMAGAVSVPNAVVETPDGRRVRTIDRLRELGDPLDPMMVVFERALAARGLT